MLSKWPEAYYERLTLDNEHKDQENHCEHNYKHLIIVLFIIIKNMCSFLNTTCTSLRRISLRTCNYILLFLVGACFVFIVVVQYIMHSALWIKKICVFREEKNDYFVILICIFVFPFLLFVLPPSYLGLKSLFFKCPVVLV